MKYGRRTVKPVCRRCGIEFDAQQYAHFCSRKCQALARTGTHTGIWVYCAVCGTEFYPRIGRRVNWTCSWNCHKTHFPPVPPREYVKKTFEPFTKRCEDCGLEFIAGSWKEAKRKYCYPCGAPSKSVMRGYYRDEKIRDRVKAATHARRVGSDGEKPLTVRELIDRDEGLCRLPGCGKPVRYDEASIGHVIPMSRWREVKGVVPGVNGSANLRLEHLKGNMRKSNKLDTEIDWSTWSCL